MTSVAVGESRLLASSWWLSTGATRCAQPWKKLAIRTQVGISLWMERVGSGLSTAAFNRAALLGATLRPAKTASFGGSVGSGGALLHSPWTTVVQAVDNSN